MIDQAKKTSDSNWFEKGACFASIYRKTSDAVLRISPMIAVAVASCPTSFFLKTR